MDGVRVAVSSAKLWRSFYSPRRRVWGRENGGARGEGLAGLPSFPGMNLLQHPDALPVSSQVSLSGFPHRGRPPKSAPPFSSIEGLPVCPGGSKAVHPLLAPSPVLELEVSHTWLGGERRCLACW